MEEMMQDLELYEKTAGMKNSFELRKILREKILGNSLEECAELRECFIIAEEWNAEQRKRYESLKGTDPDLKEFRDDVIRRYYAIQIGQTLTLRERFDTEFIPKWTSPLYDGEGCAGGASALNFFKSLNKRWAAN